MKKLIAIILAFFISMNGIVMHVYAQETEEVDRVGYRQFDHSYDDIIANALMNYETNLIDDMYGLDGRFQSHVQYVWCTRPELMSLGIVDMILWYRYSDGQHLRYEISYVDDQRYEGKGGCSIEEYQQRLAEVRQEVDALIPANATQLDIIHILHDYIITNYVYDMVMLDEIDSAQTVEGARAADKRFDYVAPGVFINHFAVCRGVSHAYSYLLSLYGIENAIAESTACNHVWNLVKLNGEWYHIDCSSDDPSYDVLGQVSHDWFMLSTDTFLQKRPKADDFEVMTSDLNMVFTDSTCARDKQYESNQVWSDSYSYCHYYNGDVYTIDRYSQLLKNGELFYQPKELMEWHPNGVTSAIYTNATVTAKLSPYGNYVYMNSPKNIYRVDLNTGESEVVFSPEEVKGWTDPDSGEVYPSANQIFGLARMNNTLYYTIETDLPKGNETWIPLDIEEPEVDVPEPEEKELQLMDSKNNNVNGKTFTMKLKDSFKLHVENMSASSSIQVSSSSIFNASIKGNTIQVSAKQYGTDTLTVNVVENGNIKQSFVVYIEVPFNGNKESIELKVGEQKEIIDETGNYEKEYDGSILDTNIASVEVIGVSEQEIPGTEDTFEKLSSFTTGQYYLGSNGKYITIINNKLSTTDSLTNATLWKIEGNTSGATISNGVQYLTHSTSSVSLSSSKTNATWLYSNSNGFYFTQSTKSWFWTTKQTYYLTINGPTVSTSNSSPVIEYKFVKGTEAVPGKEYTNIKISANEVGKTSFVVGNTLYDVIVKGPDKVVQTITVISKDENGESIADNYTISGEEGTSYTIEPNSIEGYTSPEKIEGTYGNEENIEVVLTYKKNIVNQTITITPKDENGNVIAESYTISGPEGTTYTIEPKEIEGYTTPQKVQGTFGSESHVDLTIVYSKKKATRSITIISKDENGESIADNYTISGEEGTSYIIEPNNIEGYTSPEKIEGTFGNQDNVEIILTYKKNIVNQTITIISKDENGKEIGERYTISGEVGTSYTIEPKDIDGYISPEKVEGTFENKESVEIVLTYSKSIVTRTITVTPKDENGDVIAESFTISGEVGTSYTIEPKEIDGYTSPQKIEGTFENKENVEIVLIYTKNKVIQTITIISKDENGNVIADNDTTSGEVGTSYTIEPKDIDGYTSPQKIEGTFENKENVEIVLIYTKKVKTQTITVISKDENGKEIGERYTISGEVGTSYTVEPQEIDGYTSPKKIEGTFGNGSDEIVLLYKTIDEIEFILSEDSIESGKEYVISSSSNKALSIVNGSISAVSMSIDRDTIRQVSDTSIWIITKNGNGYRIQNKGTGQYLSYKKSSSWFSSSYTLTLSSSATNWSVSKGNGYVRFYVNSSKGYLQYKNSFTLSSSSSNANMYLYKKK